MAQKTGALIFDEQTDRYDIRFDIADYYGGLVNTIIANTKGDGDKSGEDFWVSATRSQSVKSLRTSNGFPLFGELVV